MSGSEPSTARSRADQDLALAVARVADDAASTRTLVFGSLPPNGRDLDVLVRDEELEAFRKALGAAGLQNSGDVFAAFGNESAFAVDVVSAAQWGLPATEVSRLFADARPLPGFKRLVRPSPVDALLVLARRGVGSTRALNSKWTRAVDDAVLDDADAWTTAAGRARDWAVGPELARLERAWQTGGGRVGGRVTLTAHRLATARRRVARRLRGRAVIALSGLDGSGKSTQADDLVHCLGRLGINAVVVWKPVAASRLLQIGAHLGRALITRGGLGKANESAQFPRAGGVPQEPHPLEVRPRWRRWWAFAVALVSSGSLLWSTTVQLARGRVVVFDRYQLDTVMLLHARHGSVDLRAHERVIRALTPTPLRAYLLEVPATTAHARKPGKYELDELAKRAAIYRGIHGRWHVKRLDAEQTAEGLSAEIAGDVWTAVMRVRTRA